MCQGSLGLKEVQMGVHDFKYSKLPFFARKTVNINISMSAAAETSSCVPQCMCQVSIGLKGSDGGP